MPESFSAKFLTTITADISGRRYELPGESIESLKKPRRQFANKAAGPHGQGVFASVIKPIRKKP
jgi:hypothetical protein